PCRPVARLCITLPSDRRVQKNLTTTGGEAAFSPKAISFIKDISSHKKMILGFEPYGSTMQVVEFDLTGADSIAKEISSSCKWKM
ncbi:hypothetical protein LVR37_27055, partial [Klebsiella pneumoniae]|nr:hypothetical protein [Klebsiella pneumoniae]